MVIVHQQRVVGARERVPAGVSVAVGWAAMIGAAFVVAAIVPAGEPAARVVVMGIVMLVFASRVADLRAVAAVALLGSATYVGFLVNRFGELTGDRVAWAYTAVIAGAAVVGAVYRWLRVAAPAQRLECYSVVVAPAERVRAGWSR